MHYYEGDLESSIVDEFIHLRTHIKNESPINKITDLAGYIFKNNFVTIYPNIAIVLRISLCTMASNCSSER